eukprot:11507756-Heterocapsa_arctica.AAC.1
MLLKPGHRRKDLKKGVGLGAEGCGGAIMDKFKERLIMILTQVRRAGVTPLVAHRSAACLLRKSTTPMHCQE